MESTREISVADESNVQYETNETPTQDVLDEHDHSDSSRDEDSESDNECRRPTPNGHKYWFPDVPVEEKPTEGDVFDNFDEAYNMYLEYAEKASLCDGFGHNMRTCGRNKSKGKEKVIEEFEDEEEGNENETSDHATSDTE
ncbi:hypothetical protein Tco_0834452 [Tanacetum coccineum]